MKRTSKLAEIHETKRTCHVLVNYTLSHARWEETTQWPAWSLHPSWPSLQTTEKDSANKTAADRQWYPDSLCKRLNVQSEGMTHFQSEGGHRNSRAGPQTALSNANAARPMHARGFVSAFAPRRCLIDYRQNEHGSPAAAPVQLGRNADHPEGHHKT